MDTKTVLKYSEDHGAKFVSVRFTDLVGAWHHLTYPTHELDEGSFEDGFGFDASSLRGWASIHESDMLLIPDPSRVFMDPFAEEPTLGGGAFPDAGKCRHHRLLPTALRRK